jgi:hypothetical protein
MLMRGIAVIFAGLVRWLTRLSVLWAWVSTARINKVRLSLTVLLAAGLMGGVAAAQHTSKIGRPKPALPGAPPIRPLPPATIDESLLIGGDDIKVRKVDTRHKMLTSEQLSALFDAPATVRSSDHWYSASFS